MLPGGRRDPDTLPRSGSESRRSRRAAAKLDALSPEVLRLRDEVARLSDFGSSKTSVVVGKVRYLVERWRVDPSQILVTSFTRASVDDLRARIKANDVEGVTAKTFLALGLSVLGDVAVGARPSQHLQG